MHFNFNFDIFMYQTIATGKYIFFFRIIDSFQICRSKQICQKPNIKHI